MSKSLVKDLLKKLDREIQIKKLLSELNNYVNLKDSLTAVMKHCQEISNCEAIGIRLNDGKEYPYYTYEGFPPAYVVKEKGFCSMEPGIKNFQFEDDQIWSTVCLCSDIIKGRISKDYPCFTANGSFWTNQLPDIIVKKGQNRLYFGYKSVALIRILAKDECIGLIQLFSNHSRFSLDIILYLEMIGTYIGVTVYNSLIYTKMKDTLDSLSKLTPICSYCKRINDEEEKWVVIEDYLHRQTGAEFTHTICPDCMVSLYPELFAKIEAKYNDDHEDS